MFQTTMAYLGDYLANYFFHDYEGEPKSRVVYGDNEAYFDKLRDHRLILPGIVYNLSQITLPQGPSQPTYFMGSDNASGTKRFSLNTKRAQITCTFALYCNNALQSFDFIQKYMEFQSDSVIRVKYWIDEINAVEVDCALTSFEDLTIPPAGRKSSSRDSTGLIYELEGGFTMPTLFIEGKYKKIIRCIHYEKSLVPISDDVNSLFQIATDTRVNKDVLETTKSPEYKEELEERFPNVPFEQ